MSDWHTCHWCDQPEDRCICDETADGYECGECGYIPSRRELMNGTCPKCWRERKARSQTNQPTDPEES